MGIFQGTVEQNEGYEQVEVATLADDWSNGANERETRIFPNLEEAVNYARSLGQSEQDRSFIRTRGTVKTIEKAEEGLIEDLTLSSRTG